MNPGLVVKLRPTGPWRIGPDSGARNRVDVVYHSDSLYSAVTAAMARLGSLEEWLDATARASESAVSFGSCFPYLRDLGFVIPPRTIWPPTSPSAMSSRVRWKSARFVPIQVVQSLLAGERLNDNQWTIDGASSCLVPSGSSGPFRTGLRWSAAVDRLTGAVERHSTACIEFRPGCGLWTVVSFRDDVAHTRWVDPVKAAFRLLADSGFGGERSRGWGRSEAPEFLDGILPELVLPAYTPSPYEPEVEVVTAPEPEVEAAPAPPPEIAAALEWALAAEAEAVAAKPEVEPAPPAVPEAPAEPEAAVQPEGAFTEEPAAAEPEPAPPAENASAEPEHAPPIEASHEAGSPVLPMVVEPAAPSDPKPEGASAGPNGEASAAREPQSSVAVMEMEEVIPEVAEVPTLVEPALAPLAEQIVAAHPGPSAHWLLSLFTPASGDAVDWTRGNYAVLARGGRVDSPAGSGELKKQIQMVAEGSVVYAETAPCGSAANVAPDGFAHPVYRAGFALAIPLPEVR